MKAVLDVLGQFIKLLDLRTQGETEEEEKEIKTAKEAYGWLMDEMKNAKSSRVEINNDPYLQPGKMYIFKYDATHKKELDYWDKHPVVLVLGKMEGASGKIILGLNISWYPPTARKYLVEKIRHFYKDRYESAIKNKSFQANSQAPVYLDLYQLKTALDQYGLSFALRYYIPRNIKSPKVCICYEDWEKAVLLSQPRIFPELVINNSHYSLSNIYLEFKNYIKYQHNNKSEIKEKRDAAKKAMKYKFVR